MDLFKPFREGIRGAYEYAFPEAREYRENQEMMNDILKEELDKVQENLADLEIALDDVGWREMNSLGSQAWNFKRSSLKKMMDLSRRMYLKNPLMRRSVNVIGLYVWAQGVKIKADDKLVQEVMDDFFDHPKNMTALTSVPAWEARDNEQSITGNTFLALWTNEETGGVRVRILPVDQIDWIVTDPDDAKCPWYYKRVWSDGISSYVKYYPDINYNPDVKPDKLDDGNPVQWDAPVYHLKTGGLTDMIFGMPELYSILDWALAYKTLLENWATIIKAYARMAMKLTGLAGKKGIAAAKNKMGTAITTGNLRDTNTPTNTAGWMALSGGADVSAVKTAGATTSAEEGRPLKLMIAAGAGLPETFYGDSDVGNQATSTTLDRPTELKMVARQKMWMTVIQAIVDYLKLKSAQASAGKLNKAGWTVVTTPDVFDGEEVVKVVAPGEIKPFVEITFPNILERNVTDRVRAVVAATTLGGSQAEGIIPDRRFVTQLLLEALGDEDVEHHLSLLYPDGEEFQGYVDPREKLANDTLVAQGKKELGDAALDAAGAAVTQAQTAKKVANKPTPKVVSMPKGGGGVGPVSNRR